MLPAHAARIRSETNALRPVLGDHLVLQLGHTEPPVEMPYSTLRQTPPRGVLSKIAAVRQAMREFEPDLLQSHGVFATLAAAIARGIRRRPRLIYEIHGAAAYETWRRHGRRLNAAARFAVIYVLESVAILSADALLVVSDRIEQYYPTARARPSLAIPRLLDRPRGGAAVPDALVDFAARAGADGRRLVVFSGGTDEWQMLDDSLRLMTGLVASGRYRAVVLSPRPQVVADRLAALTPEPDAWCVLSVPSTAVLGSLALCDVGLLLREDAVLNAVASPTKLYEYLYAGLAVVTTKAVPEARRIVEETGCGVLVRLPVREARASPALLQDLENACEAATRLVDRRPSYLWDSAAGRLQDFLHAQCTGASTRGPR